MKTKRTPRGAGHFNLSWMSVFAVAFVSLWPALLNGGPIWMPDTPSYIRAADAAYAELFDVTADWSGEYEKLYLPPASPAEAEQMKSGSASVASELPVTLKGRSIYYGALLYAADLAGSLWLVLIFQAMLAALCILLTLHALVRAGEDRPRAPPIMFVGLMLAVATPLSFFVSYLMPDIFGAFALLAMMNLLFLWKMQSGGARVFFLALLAYAILSHNLNLILAVLLLCGFLLLRLVERQNLERSAVVGVASCIALGFIGQSAFEVAVERVAGAPPVRPPFLAMRIIADGPGLHYLQEHCDSRPFLYCRTKDAIQVHSDTLLWSMDPEYSLFRGLSYSDQRRAAAEQNRFVIAVLMDRPVAVVRVLSHDVLEQLIRFDLGGFNYSEGQRERYASATPPRAYADITTTRAFTNTLPVRPTELSTAVLTALSLTILIIFLLRSRKIRAMPHLRGACLFILFAIGLNAALSGALSGPKGRYQMRLVWILPLVAAGVVIARPAQRSLRI